jgi:hypothetical protein
MRQIPFQALKHHFKSENMNASTIIDFLDIVYRPVFYLKTTFRRLDSVSVFRYF